ncbi:MAG: efflux RND transporter periplasmic adaptor subunit [Candidatus Krumholzibacteriia bacterium]
MKRKLIIGGVALVVVLVIVVVNLRRESPDARVQATEVTRRDLTAVVSASGTIQPKRSVNVSANAIGTITRLAVAEGDRVRAGDFLLEIDPTQYASTVQALEAAVRTMRADLELALASLEKAELDLRRAEDLYAEQLASEEELQAARTTFRVQQAQVQAARHRLEQQDANLAKARHDLRQVTISAPMAGVVTRLNVEQGESAIMGTLNNPGTVLLVIAALDTMEAWVEVDETEVVDVEIGQAAGVTIDAFPDSTFEGRVTEIGNSPVLVRTGASQEAVDFEVKITLERAPARIRPGLSAKAEITVADRRDVLAVPLGAVTVRPWPLRQEDVQRYRGRREQAQRRALEPLGFVPADSLPREAERKDAEGVFVVRDGFARFVPVQLGIAGEEHFEIVSGLDEGMTVITGPFRILRELDDGTWVEIRGEDR